MAYDSSNSWLRIFWPPTLATRLFLLVTLFEFLIDTTIEVVIFAKGQAVRGFFTGNKEDERNDLPVYLGLFVMAHLFQLVLAGEAVYNKNTIQILGLTIFNALFLVYSIIEIGEVKKTFQDLTGSNDTAIVGLTTAIPVVISLCEVAYIALSWQLYKEFGWSIFKSLGADRRIRRYYLVYQVFICTLKFDYFFFLALSLQFVLLVLGNDDAERWLTVAATPIILLILILGYFAVRWERRALTWTFIGFCVLGAGYFTFKLFRIYVGSEVAEYLPAQKSLTTFAAISLLMDILSLIMAVLCLRNFDKGLIYHFRRDKPRKATDAGYLDSSWSSMGGSTYKLNSAAGSRLSID